MSNGESAMRPLLAITMGDPAGVGPEIVVKALCHDEVFAQCRPLVIGDGRMLYRAASWLGIEDEFEYELLAEPSAGSYQPGVISLLNLDNADPALIAPGILNAAAGQAAVDSVFRACDLAMDGAVDAIVTAPLNKEAMFLAGHNYAGHTELLTETNRRGKGEHVAGRPAIARRPCEHPCFPL